ncbi:MAG TPA: hypothetical protein VET65_02950 [Candidatus Limnocylindrales bacterium]|nr:hypothetical protein [Candidatus Limnocylindrales bacterium]
MRMVAPARAGGKPAIALLVEADEADRERYGAWLEGAGIGVINCPGPKRDDFTCLGVRGERCGLVEIADLAILDVRLLDDAYRPATGSRRLLHYYLNSGKPIVLVGSLDRSERRIRDDQVALVRRPSARSLVSAVRRLLQATG